MITHALSRLKQTAAIRNPSATLQELKKDLSIRKKIFSLMVKKQKSEDSAEKSRIKDEVDKLRESTKTQYSVEQLETKIKNFKK